MRRVTGRWRIVEMDLWDRDAIDLLGPAFIEIGADGAGSFRFIAVEGDIDGRHVERDGHPAVEFSWVGVDDNDDASGRGWAFLEMVARSSVTSTSIAATTPASGQLPCGRPNSPAAPDPPTVRKRRATGSPDPAIRCRGCWTRNLCATLDSFSLRATGGG